MDPAFIEDDRRQHLARVDPATGKLVRVLDGRRETTDFDSGPKNRVVVLDSTVDQPAELHAVEGGKTRRLTHQNDAWLADVRLAAVEESSVTSQGRYADRRLSGQATGLRLRTPLSDGPAHPRRAGRSVREYLHADVADSRRARLRRGGRESARQLRTRREVREGDLRRLGQQGRGGRARRRRRRRREGRRRSRRGSASVAGATAAS